MKSFIPCILISLPLFACGGGGGDSKPQTSVAPDYSHLSKAPLKPTPLREASSTELSNLVKNGLRISLREHSDVNGAVRDNALVATNNSAEGADNFSGTNVQVSGVDEADHVKYDGRYIYLATPVDYNGEAPSASLKIFSTDPNNASVSEISNTNLDASYWGDIGELYLVGNGEQTTGLASIRRSWGMMHIMEPMDTNRAAMSLFAPYPMESGIHLSLYNVQNPSSPDKTWSLTLDGDLLGSRKIGNMLYLVSSFVPHLGELNYAATSTQEKIANEQHISNSQIQKLLPEYRINDGSPQPLSNTCLIANTTSDTQGYLNLVNITAIDLATQQLVESVCINSNTQGIYVSHNHLYLGASDTSRWENWDEFTVVHKFSLSAEGVDYRATGSVEGSLGWSAASFRMDEHNDYLRIITTHYDDSGEPIHQLHLLQENNSSQQLTLIAQLPNETHPEAIGKPREDIYAVRFYGDRAYVVTFERKDPLYVLDLTNPTAPQIAGQLELPGFSTYLHPVGDDYLFSFGYETDANGLQTGIKAGLFDIRNLNNPQLIGQHLLGDNLSHSQALYDHRALSFLQASEDQLRISLPLISYSNNSGSEDVWLYQPQASLQLLAIKGLSGDTASLQHLGEVQANNTQENNYWYGNDRSLLHNNSVFYIYGTAVTGSLWPQE